MIAQDTPTHNVGGGFAKGNKLGARQSSRGNATAKQLKQLCIDVLQENGISGRPMIEDVIRTVARDKPEALLPFAGKLIPQESEVVTTKVSPIVLSSDITPKIGVVESVVIEQSVTTTNAEPIKELVSRQAITVKKVVKTCSIVIDEEL